MKLSIFWAFVAPLLCTALAQTFWPLPQSYTSGSSTIFVDPNTFSFLSTGQNSDILQKAFLRYQNLIFKAKLPFSPKFAGVDSKPNIGDFAQVDGLEVSVISADTTLTYGVDESYTLTITSPRSTIKANTVYGALRGLETFSQSIVHNVTAGYYYIPNVPISIQDHPRFPHRGMLIDSSRHFLAVESILKMIDALEYNKMNVLHWHAVDAQSFPIQSDLYPLLSLRGSYMPQLTYSKQDIQTIVQYAKERGVRVVVEFDVPGHAYSWGLGYPDLVVNCPKYAANVNNIPLDPSKESTYQFLQTFFNEMVSLFPDAMFHTGGDEVVYGCWGQDANLVSWTSSKGFTTYNQVLAYFEDRVQKILRPLGKTIVNWQEVFDAAPSLPLDTVYEIWKDQATLNSVVKAGYRAILAYGWYLDHLTLTWQDFYNNEPVDSTLTAAQQALIIGGDVAMWGEQVDGANIEQRVWPRAAAAAERLWSARTVTDQGAALFRLLDHRCRLVRRGIDSAPIQPGFCTF